MAGKPSDGILLQERTVSDPKYATSLQVSLYTDKDGFKLIGQPAFSDSDPTTSEAVLRADPATFPKGEYRKYPLTLIMEAARPLTDGLWIVLQNCPSTRSARAARSSATCSPSRSALRIPARHLLRLGSQRALEHSLDGGRIV